MFGRAPSTATRMCDRLVAKNLIDRTVDAANRRQAFHPFALPHDRVSVFSNQEFRFNAP